MRLILGDDVRFSHVEAHLAQVGLVVADYTSQVFPGRNEPARVVWADADGAEVAVFRYFVNPDRRVLDLVGDDAADLAAIVDRRLGTQSWEGLIADLRGDDADLAFCSAFKVADSGDPRACRALSQVLVATLEPHVSCACIRSLEIVGDEAALPVLDSVRLDPDRSGEVRALATAAAETLRARGL